METNEQGLTKEEKVMFSILGIILIIAIGVLIINSISSKERTLEENNSAPITENKGQEDNKKDETITNNSDSNLIEDTTVQSDIVINNEPIIDNSSSNQLENIVLEETKPEVEQLPEKEPVIEEQPSIPEDPEEKPSIPEEPEDNDGTGSTFPEIAITWEIKDTVITEAYTNDEIVIEKNILLSDGTEAEAAVTVRKKDGETYNIVDIFEGKFIVTEGMYKYYYTYNDVTKELDLIVKNHLELEKVEFLTLSEEYQENLDTETSITEDEYNNIKENMPYLTLSKEENNYVLTSSISLDKLNYIPLLVTFNDEIINKEIKTDTLGVTLKQVNELWHKEISTKDLIVILDIKTFNIEENKITINIDNKEYEILLNIVEQLPSESEQDENKTCSDENNCENNEKTEENKNSENDEENIEDNKTSQEQEKNPEEPTLENENTQNNKDVPNGENTDYNDIILDGETPPNLSE